MPESYPTSPYIGIGARPTRRQRDALERRREEYYRSNGHSPEKASELARADTIDEQLKRLCGR